MTFKQFKTVAEKYRPDIIVHKHGDYCHGCKYDDKTMVGVTFKNGDNKVYNYKGSYAVILSKLGINNVVEKSDIKQIKGEIDYLKNQHGQEILFSEVFYGEVRYYDNTNKIKEYEDTLEAYLSDEYIRVWEL